MTSSRQYQRADLVPTELRCQAARLPDLFAVCSVQRFSALLVESNTRTACAGITAQVHTMLSRLRRTSPPIERPELSVADATLAYRISLNHRADFIVKIPIVVIML